MLDLPDKDRSDLLNQLQQDTDWLQRLGLMDYSLLVGVGRLTDDSDEATSCGLFGAGCGESDTASDSQLFVGVNSNASVAG